MAAYGMPLVQVTIHRCRSAAQPCKLEALAWDHSAASGVYSKVAKLVGAALKHTAEELQGHRVPLCADLLQTPPRRPHFGDNFGASLGGSQTFPELLDFPEIPHTSPEVPL